MNAGVVRIGVCSAVVLAACLALATAGLGQANRSRTVAIEGTVLSGGQAITERVDVVLEAPGWQELSSTIVDNLGRFRFPELPSSSYFVVVRLNGFDEYRTQISSNATGTVALRIVLVPTRRDAVILGATDRIVDIRELGNRYSAKALDEYEKGIDEYQSGNFEKAAARLTAALTEAPEHFGARFLLGQVYQRLERYREAKAEYTRAREINPKAVSPLTGLGSVFIQEADALDATAHEQAADCLRQALDVLHEALRVDRGARVAYYFLGVAYYKLGEFDRARSQLALAGDLEEEGLPVGLIAAYIDIRQERWEEALDRLDGWRAANPAAKSRERVDELRAAVQRSLEARR